MGDQGEGSRGKGGGKWGEKGEGSGDKREGSGDKGGRKWGMPTPLSTPSIKVLQYLGYLSNDKNAHLFSTKNK